MSYDPLNPSARTGYAGPVIDAGLQSYMQGIYRTMCWGLAVTGATAYAVANTPGVFNLLFHSIIGSFLMLGAFIFMIFGFRPSSFANAPVASLHTKFVIYSALMGLMLSILFQLYTGASIARVFFITSATFAGTSLYGYTTRRDLTGVGSFMFMGLWGIVIAGFVNVFLHSAMVQFVTSFAGVIIFTGMTAWQTQYFKDAYRAGDADGNARLIIQGALDLYLSFVNLFIYILQLTGDQRR